MARAMPQTSRPPPIITSMGPRRCLLRAPPPPAPSARACTRSRSLAACCCCCHLLVRPPFRARPSPPLRCARAPPLAALPMALRPGTHALASSSHSAGIFESDVGPPDAPPSRSPAPARVCARSSLPQDCPRASSSRSLGSAQELSFCVPTTSRSRPRPRSATDVMAVCIIPAPNRITALLARPAAGALAHDGLRIRSSLPRLLQESPPTSA